MGGSFPPPAVQAGRQMFDIQISADAKRHLKALTARNRRAIAAAIEEELAHQPLVETRNRKPLWKNPLASWELRVEQFRVL